MNTNMSRREFLAWSAAGLAAAGMRPARGAEFVPVGSVASTTYPETSAALAVGDPSRIKLLQLTDLHFFCKRDQPELDKRTIDDLPRLVEHAQPDLVMVTGDFWHDNPEGRGQEQAEFAIAQIAALGVPWIFTWGNHDMLNDYVKGHDTFHDAKHSLYRGGPSAGNYVIELKDKSGANVWDLVCVNSSSRGIEEPQRAWLAELAKSRAGKTVPTFGVFHIPLKQQIEAWDKKEARGIRLNGGGSAEKENGGALPLLKALGARAGFCGHIHTFDFGAQADGVELVFGHATGWAGWGADVMPKGGKVITLNAQSGSYAWESLFADGSRWQPKPGEQIDKLLDTPWDAPAKHKAA